MLNVMVVGSGAREHAIVWKLLLSDKVKDVYVAPGNGGTALIARNLDIPARDIKALADAALSYGINLAIVGPEDPLALGIVDVFESLGIRTFGPSKRAAMIEASKSFAKALMLKHGIPCARGVAFTSRDQAGNYVAKQPLPVVIKADGLAAGKGVTVARTYEQAFQALDEAMVERAFGDAGNTVLVEECLVGREVSLLCFTDGKTVVPMVPACDYKPIYDNDEGPNTGGMGCYSPPSFFGPEMVEQVKSTILEPMVSGMAAEGIPYRGVLYAGLMMTADGLRVLEFNCRFGDPETQAILPRLKTDLVDIAQAVISGTLDQLSIEWSEERTVGVVLASGGYPGSYARGHVISGLDSLDNGLRVFHAGTRLEQRTTSPKGASALLPGRQVPVATPELTTDGGRVLTIVANGRTMTEARRKVYANVSRITFDGCHFRTDIAAREVFVDEETQPDLVAPQLEAQGGPADNPEARQLLARAEALLATGRSKDAIDMLEKTLELQPDFWAARAALGTAYAALGDLGRAIEQWQEVIKASPEDAEAHHNLGSLYLRQGRLDLGIDEMNEAIRLDSKYLPAYLGLGALAAKQGQYDKATTYYRLAIGIDPNSAEAHLDYAILLFDTGSREQARAEVEACLRANPEPETRREAEQIQKKLSKRGWF